MPRINKKVFSSHPVVVWELVLLSLHFHKGKMLWVKPINPANQIWGDRKMHLHMHSALAWHLLPGAAEGGCASGSPAQQFVSVFWFFGIWCFLFLGGLKAWHTWVYFQLDWPCFALCGFRPWFLRA